MNNIVRILIWGAGNLGKGVYEKLSKYKTIQIIGFGDNDSSKVGTLYCGVPVISVDSLIDNQKNIDFVIISVFAYEAIYDQLSKIVDVPVYRNYGDFYSEILSFRCSIDISGWCNAKCKYCYTGRKNRECFPDKTYMSFENFSKIHQHLVESKILYGFNEVMLYSWGEPLLNPDYLKIIDYLSEQGQTYSLSTNGSVLKLTDNPCAYENCLTVIFSLSGMTQESYGNIHGFDLQIIKKNIKELLSNMRQHGFKGAAKVSFHVYKFNKDEVTKAREFAEELGVEFVPIKAYLASWSLQNSYLRERINQEFLKEIESELYLENVHNFIKDRPTDYRCPLENILSVDENGFIELCCCCDKDAKDFLWKNIMNIKSVADWKSYRNDMLTCQTCKECRDMGVDYWICNGENYHEQ